MLLLWAYSLKKQQKGSRKGRSFFVSYRYEIILKQRHSNCPIVISDHQQQQQATKRIRMLSCT